MCVDERALICMGEGAVRVRAHEDDITLIFALLYIIIHVLMLVYG